MPYLKGGKGNYVVRVVTRSNHRSPHSTGTRHLTTARAVEAWVRELRSRLDMSGVLQAIHDGDISLVDAYALGEQGAALELKRRAEAAQDIDLVPLLDEWEKAKLASARGAASAVRFKRQIRVLFPLTPWRRSTLTTVNVAGALDRLTCNDPTRNRYRAALSSFCKWLVRRGVIEQNVAIAVSGYSERAGRTVWYDEATSDKVLHALPQPYRALEALMCDTGMDWSDCAALRVEDIDTKARTIRCHGSKTEWRNRVIRYYTRFPLIAPALHDKTPGALVFEVRHDRALQEHHAAVKAVGAPRSRLHDWRHTFAVNALKRGEVATVVAHQLGHRDAHLVWTRYGRFVPTAGDYKADSATNVAPSTDLPIPTEAHA